MILQLQLQLNIILGNKVIYNHIFKTKLVIYTIIIFDANCSIMYEKIQKRIYTVIPVNNIKLK